MELSHCIRRAAKALAKLEKAQQSWDFKSFDQCRTTIATEMHLLASIWEGQIAQGYEELQKNRARLDSESYRQELEGALGACEIPFEGGFPSYTTGPFTLQVDPGDGVVRLRFGRRVEKTSSLDPATIARWVQKHYDGVVNRPFNSEKFHRDLLSSYEVGNRLAYHSEKGQVLWGQPVSLEQMYQLLTLRNEVRQEYRTQHFLYDLARLRKEGLTYGKYRLEFGFVRG